MSEKVVASLLEERRGYVMRNLPDRVAAVDEVLAMFGHHTDVDEDVEMAVEDGGKTAARKRK